MPSLPQRFLSSPLRCASLLALLLASGALQAQNLNELYEAARAYDATYLSARSLAESAEFKAAQAEALRLPSASLTGSATAAEIHTVTGANVGTRTAVVGVQGRHPLFNRSNTATLEQAKRALAVSQADLEAAEQDLIVRVSQAYFDVLAAQDALRSAPPPSPTHVNRRRASTWPLRVSWWPTTTCAPSAPCSTSWWAATRWRPRAWRCRWRCRRCCQPTWMPG